MKGSAEFCFSRTSSASPPVGFLVFGLITTLRGTSQRVYSHFQGFGAVLMLINVGFAALHVFCAETFDLLRAGGGAA